MATWNTEGQKTTPLQRDGFGGYGAAFGAGVESYNYSLRDCDSECETPTP